MVDDDRKAQRWNKEGGKWKVEIEVQQRESKRPKKEKKKMDRQKNLGKG